MKGEMKNILVTGALGQIGSELTMALRERYGAENVVAADIREIPDSEVVQSGPFYYVDVTQRASLDVIIRKHKIDTIFHMAAILSATGEKNPKKCWEVNVGGTLNVLNAAVDYKLTRSVRCASDR